MPIQYIKHDRATQGTEAGGMWSWAISLAESRKPPYAIEGGYQSYKDAHKAAKKVDLRTK